VLAQLDVLLPLSDRDPLETIFILVLVLVFETELTVSSSALFLLSLFWLSLFFLPPLPSGFIPVLVLITMTNILPWKNQLKN